MTAENPLTADGGGDWPAARAWPHAAWRATYDRLAVRLFHRDPATALRVLGTLGAVASRCGWQGPRAAEVRELFPWLRVEESSAIARASTALLFRNRAAIALVARHGLASLSSLLVERQATAPALLAGRAKGAILVGFHMGAHFGIGAALHRWGVQAFSVRETTLRDADTRARALKHAVDVLRDGGVVLAVADGPRGANTPLVTCLGRRVRFRRGPFMLARVTGAPMLPAIARWTSAGELDVAIHPPLVHDERDPEAALVEGAARWFETFVHAHPEVLWPYTIRNLLGTPSALEQHLIPEDLVMQPHR